MKLKRLNIEVVPSYRENPGEYEGVAEFTGKAGNVQLKLTPTMCNEIFHICADGILSVAKDAAENLTCNIIDHQKALSSDEGTIS